MTITDDSPECEEYGATADRAGGVSGEPIGPGAGAAAGRIALACSTLLTGVFAGFFLTYEISVTRGLAEVDTPVYVETFQWINRTIRNPEFAVVFFGTVPALVIALLMNRRAGKAVTSLLAMSIFFAVLTIIVTAVFNIPLNRELDMVDSVDPAVLVRARADFEDPWNTWNLIRSLTALMASGFAVAALSVRPAR